MPRRGYTKPFHTDKRTRRWIDDFLTAEIEEMHNHSEGSYPTIRSHLREAIRASYASLGHRSLVAIAEAEDTEHNKWLRRLMNELDSRHSGGHCLNITYTLALFFDHLVTFADDVDVDGHNVRELRKRKGWEYNRQSPKFEPDPEVIKNMYRSATTDWQRSLVILFAGAGLRTKDIERIHVNDINPDPNDPHISFADRKTNPGEIAVMAGMPVLKRRARKVRLKSSEDNPPLFPSEQSKTGTRRGSWATNKIKELSKEAGERRPDGDPWKPKDLGTTYKNKYVEARSLWVKEVVGDLTDNLNLDSEKVQDEHYLQNEKFRDLFTDLKNSKFQEMFPSEIIHDNTLPDSSHLDDQEQSRLNEYLVEIFGLLGIARGTITAAKHTLRETITWSIALNKRWQTDKHAPDEDIAKLVGFITGMALITAVGFYQLGMGIDLETMTIQGHPLQWVTVILGHTIAIALHYKFETMEVEGFVPASDA